MPFDLVQYVLILTDESNISLVKSVNIQYCHSYSVQYT